MADPPLPPPPPKSPSDVSGNCSPGAGSKVKKFLNNPQISITDTQGHHVVGEEEEEDDDDEDSSTEEEEMEEDDNSATTTTTTTAEMLQQQQQQYMQQQQLLQQQQQQQQLLLEHQQRIQQEQQQQQHQLWQEYGLPQMLLQYNAAAAAAANSSNLPHTYPGIFADQIAAAAAMNPATAQSSSGGIPTSHAGNTVPATDYMMGGGIPAASASNNIHDFCIGLRRTMSDILCEIKKVLDRKQSEVIYQQEPDNRLLLANTNMQMELQFLPAQGITENRLKFRRISGDKSSYSQLCQELLNGIK